MEIGENTNSTNNLAIRFWSPNHYGKKLKKSDNIYDGTIQDGNNSYHFHSVAEMLKVIEKSIRQKEKDRQQKFKKV